VHAAELRELSRRVRTDPGEDGPEVFGGGGGLVGEVEEVARLDGRALAGLLSGVGAARRRRGRLPAKVATAEQHGDGDRGKEETAPRGAAVM